MNKISAILTMVMAIVLAACSTDTPVTPDGTSKTNGEVFAKPGSGGGTANPAFVFQSMEGKGANFRLTVAVSNVDGTNTKSIYSTTDSYDLWFSTWSPTGSSVSFVEMPYNNASGVGWNAIARYGAYAIKSVDVAVNNGVVSSSNTRTIYSNTTSDSARIIMQAWSPATSGPSAGLIAFLVMTPTHTKIYTVPSNGGTPTLVASTSRTSGTDRFIGPSSLTWCNGGANLAYTLGNEGTTGTFTDAIKIVDLDGTVVATLFEGSTDIRAIRGSSGNASDLLMVTYESEYKAYVIGTASGSTPTYLTTIQQSTMIEWSPDNTEAIANLPNAGTNKINISTGAATPLNGGATMKYGDWK